VRRQHWSILKFDVRTIQEFYMKEISSMDFPQHGEVFYFYGQALPTLQIYVFKYCKAEEFVCLLDRANLRNYSGPIKKILSVLDSPFIENGYGLC
jgi:hypothetical protein